MNIASVITVRLDSERLPGKALLRLGNRTMLGQVVERCREIGYPVIIATAEPPPEQYQWLTTAVFYKPGLENQVTERLVLAAHHYDIDHVIRVTADCPFIDVWAAQQTVLHHLESGADFTHHVAEGRGVEVFTYKTLKDSAEDGEGPELEHPDLYILHNPHLFHIELMKFSVDTPEDLERARRRIHGEEAPRFQVGAGVDRQEGRDQQG